MDMKKVENFEPAYHGFDFIFKNKEGIYVIVEAKGGAGTLAKTVDGAQQMSQKWIKKRIDDLVKSNPELGVELLQQFNSQSLETMVVYTKLDQLGNVLDPVYELKSIAKVGQNTWKP
jgi:hypothetical protein